MALLTVIVAATWGEVSRLAWCIPVAAGLEFVAPRVSPWKLRRLKGATLWAIYFLLTGLILAGERVMFVALKLPALIVVPGSGFGLAFVAPIAMSTVADFFYYWTHRAQHAVPFLWRFHAVHHSIRDLNAFNSFHHWTEEAVRLPLLTPPLALLLRFDVAQLAIVSAVLSFQSIYLHSTTRLNLGFFVRVIADNRTHRIHHSLEARHVGHNFGAFTTVWDQMFGTAYFPEPGEWPETGLDDRPECPGALSYLLAARPTQASA